MYSIIVLLCQAKGVIPQMVDLSGGKGSEARRGAQAVVVAGRERGRREVVEVLHGGGVPAVNRVVLETGNDHIAQRLEEHLERKRGSHLVVYIDGEIEKLLVLHVTNPVGATHYHVFCQHSHIIFQDVDV